MTTEIKVEDGKYRQSGAFHTAEPGAAIRNDAGELCGITNPRRVVHIHSYGGEAPFFQGLADGKLLGTRCPHEACESTGTVYLPYRIHCPDCLGAMEPVDLTDIARDAATIHSFMTTERTGAFNTLDRPIRFINVEFPGVATILMSYLLGGTPAIGDRVVPIFRTTDPSYTITDLAFVRADSAGDLPTGFSF